MIKWEKYIKKYVWNENVTPFFIAAPRLTKRQARKEVFLFTVFLSTPFLMIAATAMALVIDQHLLKHFLLFVYAASVVVAAVIMHWRKTVRAAAYCMTAPVAILAYFTIFGFPEKLQFVDQAIVIVINLLWLRYTMRIHSIARHYNSLEDGQPES